MLAPGAKEMRWKAVLAKWVMDTNALAIQLVSQEAGATVGDRSRKGLSNISMQQR